MNKIKTFLATRVAVMKMLWTMNPFIVIIGMTVDLFIIIAIVIAIIFVYNVLAGV